MNNKEKNQSYQISPTIIAVGFSALTLTTLLTWKIYTSNFFKNNIDKKNTESIESDVTEQNEK